MCSDGSGKLLLLQPDARSHTVLNILLVTKMEWGRLYTQQASGQQLPKVVRKLVYGRSHKEVDMSGAHYEIVRRLVRSDSLPPIKELRTRLYAAWSPHVSSDK